MIHFPVLFLTGWNYLINANGLWQWVIQQWLNVQLLDIISLVSSSVVVKYWVSNRVVMGKMKLALLKHLKATSKHLEHSRCARELQPAAWWSACIFPTGSEHQPDVPLEQPGDASLGLTLCRVLSSWPSWGPLGTVTSTRTSMWQGSHRSPTSRRIFGNQQVQAALYGSLPIPRAENISFPPAWPSISTHS